MSGSFAAVDQAQVAFPTLTSLVSEYILITETGVPFEQGADIEVIQRRTPSGHHQGGAAAVCRQGLPRHDDGALAEAAGVSEALLFKHFPNKEALYSAMLLACCPARDNPVVERLQRLEPSASTLVILLHWFSTHLIEGGGPHEEDQEIQHRLMLRSLLEDGDFARLFLERVAAGWVGKLEECLQAAIAAGEAVASPVQPRLANWFYQHIVIMIRMHCGSATPTLDYGVRPQGACRAGRLVRPPRHGSEGGDHLPLLQPQGPAFARALIFFSTIGV